MSGNRSRAAAALALLTALALAACGSSSGGSASAGTATSASSTTANGRPDPTKLRACLAQHGVKLPARPPGAGGQTGTQTTPSPGSPPAGVRRGFFFGGGGARMSTAQRQKLQAAFQACGGRAFGRRFGGGPGRFRANAPAFRAALAKYVACVRKNGFALPAPNTSGKGPVFDPGKVNQRDPKFLAASAKCQGLLRGPGGAPGGGSGAPPPGA